MEQRWTISLPKDKFDEIKKDLAFCSVTALARAVNAIHFVQSPLLTSENDDTPAGMRTRYNSLLFTCALFAEATLLVQKMHKHFKQEAAFQEIVRITASKEAQAVLNTNLFKLRNRLVFHFGIDEIENQLGTLNLENPIFVSGLGSTKYQTYLEMADIAALRTLLGNEFPKDIEKVRPIIKLVVELTVKFLTAAENFMVAVLKERNWTTGVEWHGESSVDSGSAARPSTIVPEK
jgi:hypothetical protein